MRTELDRRMDEGLAMFTSETGPLPVGSITLDGVDLPMILAAPPALPQYFAHYAAEHKDKTFLVAGDERLTFAQVYGEAEKVARSLVGEGLMKGERVGIAMRNSPSWITLYMGITMAGGIACLLNGWWQSEELASAISDEPKLVHSASTVRSSEAMAQNCSQPSEPALMASPARGISTISVR